MAKSIRKFLKSFTLIELIIVIAIIAVLGATAFIVLSEWMSKSRDSRKIADLGTIDTAINVSFTSKDVLPTPDNMTNMTFGGAKVWELGFFGDEAVSQIGGALTKTPSDPTTKAWYRYAVWNNKYQLGTIIENEQFSKYLNRTYAQSYFTKVQGNYNQSIIVAKIGSDDVIIPAPSLIVDEFEEGNKELQQEYFWVNKNIYNLGEEQTNTIQVQTLFSGNITDLKDPTNFDNFKNKFADTYSGSVYMKELTTDLDENQIEEIVSAELKKVSTQNVSVQYLSCDGTAHGQTKLFYKENNVAFGQNCEAYRKEFKCENGVWKDGESNADFDLYKYFTCTVGPASNCEATTNSQTSLSGINITFNIPATEHGLGFNAEQTVNESNGTYKYSLGGNCNNGIFESIVLGSRVLESCDSNYLSFEGQCFENRWIGDAVSGFSFINYGQLVYPKSCNDILVSSNPNFKIGSTLPFNGTSFADGVYWIKPSTTVESVYCNFSFNGTGRSLVMNLDTNDGGVRHFNSAYWTDSINYGSIGNSIISDYKNGSLFTLGSDKLIIAVHVEGNLLAYKEYSLNEINKSLYYYFNKGNNIRITNGTVNSFGLSSLNNNEPTVKQTVDLYLNTRRGLTSTDNDRISIGGSITDNYGGGLGTYYDSGIAGNQRPYGDGQLLSCGWAGSNGCTIGSDNSGTNSIRNVASGLQYDYSFYIK